MALRLRRGYSLNSLVLLEYWRVTAINIDFHNRIAVVNLSGYLTPENRIEGGAPIENLQFVFRDNRVDAPINGVVVPHQLSWPFSPGCNLQEVVYTTIKKLPDWAGAEDLN